MKEKILITGLPHSGKSTLLNRLLESVSQKQGFVTMEIQVNGQRTGFMLRTSSGTESVLASVDSNSPLRVSRYGVEKENLEKLLPELSQFTAEDLLYIDEIGQMELFSEDFKKLVNTYLEAGNVFVGTISKIYAEDFTRAILSRDDIRLFELTPDNRERVYEELRKRLVR